MKTFNENYFKTSNKIINNEFVIFFFLNISRLTNLFLLNYHFLINKYILIEVRKKSHHLFFSTSVIL